VDTAVSTGEENASAGAVEFQVVDVVVVGPAVAGGVSEVYLDRRLRKGTVEARDVVPRKCTQAVHGPEVELFPGRIEAHSVDSAGRAGLHGPFAIFAETFNVVPFNLRFRDLKSAGRGECRSFQRPKCQKLTHVARTDLFQVMMVRII
jgi:hypothetical protein